MVSLRTHLPLKALLAVVMLGVCLPLVGADQKEPPQLTTYTNDQINDNLRPAIEAKNWDKALSVIDTVLAKVPAESYDAAIMYQIQAQMFLQKSSLTKALDALEHSQDLADRHQFFAEKNTLENVYNIAQLEYQVGASSKDPKVQKEYFGRTLTNLERWMKATDPHKYTQDNVQFISSVYFTIGQGGDINGVQKSDPEMLDKALHWIDVGLRSAIHPRDVFYQLKIAALVQLNRYKDAYELLELRLKQKPDNRSYWQQLAFTYMQLANMATEKHQDQDAYTYNVRAILTLQRAEAHGFMDSPKEHYNLVGLYFTIDQYSRACDLLSAGLKDGKIESTLQNWQLLAYSYQEQHQDKKAIETLVEAAKAFPNSGQLEYQIAQVYYGMNDEVQAFDHMKLCLAKGGTEKPQVGWMFDAFLAYDLKKYDEATKAANEALKYPETKKDAARMLDAIKASLQDIKNRQGSP